MTVVDIADQTGPYLVLADSFAAYNHFLMTLGVWRVSPAGFLSTPFAQWRTIVREIRHNLGLRHCGTTPIASVCEGMPAIYECLMSYAHRIRMGTGVTSYSPRVPGIPDRTFDDWFNLRPDFSRAQIHLGNTRLLGLGAAGVLPPGSTITADDIGERELDYSDHLQMNGPLDVQSPTLQITAPTAGSNFLQSQNLPVVVEATDDVSLALGSVMVRFDVDGSGAIDGTGEVLVGTPTGTPNEFEVTFTNLAGPNGVRNIDARATDTSSNVGQDIVPIVVPEPGVTLILCFAVPFLTLLDRRRKRARSSHAR